MDLLKNERIKHKLYFLLILSLILLIDLILVFNLTRKEYTVVFVDGENITSFIVKENNKVFELSNQKENFLGWYSNNNKYDFDEEIHNNLILNAKYEDIVMYKVIFDTDGGNAISPVMVKSNKTLVEPSEPQKENYQFVGWMLEQEFYDFNKPITSDITLKAKWDSIPDNEKKYTITFDSNGGSEVKKITVETNVVPSKPTNPTKEGYIFKEWTLNGKTFNWNNVILSNIILKAEWTAKKTLKISFDSNGGTKIDSISVYKDETAELPTPTRVGFAFVGWYYQKNEYTNNTKITNNLTLTAKWVTADEASAIKASEAIKSNYEIIKGGTKIRVTYAGCVINNTNPEIIDEITRDLTDKKINLNFQIECGTVKKTKTSQAIIKASTYTYSIKDSKLNINGTNFDGEIFKMDGTKIANVISGIANIEELNENIIFKIYDDSKTSYILKRQ